MKKIIYLLGLMLFMGNVNAQSCAWPGYSNEGNFNPGCTPAYTSVPTMGPGHYFTFTAYAGITYEFQNCATGNWDSDVRIMRNDNGTELHYHDGNSGCGAAGCGGSSASGYHSNNNQWASTYTGAVRVVLSRFGAANCGSGASYGYESCQTSTNMTFRAITTPSIGTYAHSTLYTCNTGGNTYSSAGNIVTNSVSGTLGGISWQWGTSGGAWNSWGTGNTAGGNCCFPLNPSSAQADRMRAVATNGGCTIYGPTVLVQSDNMTAPASASSSLTTVCSSSPATITLSYTGGATGVLGSAEWYTGSCGGTSIGSGNNLSIAKPTGSTTYYVRFENPCTQTACAEVFVSVPTISLSAEVTNPTCFGASDGAIDLTVNTTPPSFGSSLTLWTKGDSGIETNGVNDVTRWNDLSGNNNDFVTNFGSNTKIQASSINGRPAVRFNNASVMESPNFVSNPYTMFVVGKMNSGTNARLVSSGTTNWLFGWWGGNRDRMYADGWVLQGPATNITDPYLYAVSGTGALTTFWRNGTQIASNAGGVSAPGIISLGGWGTGNSERSNGDVAEVIVYNKVLTAAERQEVESYLGLKYNISGPSGTQTYSWTPGGATTEDVTGLADGSYSVTVTTDGCAETLSGIMVSEPADIVITGTAVDEGCPVDNDGTITVSLAGGFTNVQYVRLTQKRPDVNNAINLQELQAFEIFTGTNVAQGKTVTGTSAHVSYPFSNLTDNEFSNSTTGMYHSASPYNTGDYVQVDLGASFNLDNLVITNRSDCCQNRADNLDISLYDASLNLLYTSNVNAGGATYTHNVLDVSWSDAGSTLNRTGLDVGTYTLTVADVNACSDSEGYTIATANTLSSTPATAAAAPTFVCAGDAVTLTATGTLGTGADFEWYSDAALTTNVGTGASVTVNPTNNTTYYVRAEGTCNTTSDINTVQVFVNGSSISPSGASLNGATASATCNVSGTSWHYFYTSSGDLLAAINPNGNNLGSVTVDITVGDDGPVGTGYAPGVCGSPGANGGEYVLARYWDISVATQPSSAVDVKFYYLGAELTTFQALVGAQNAAYLSCWGNVTGESDLMMTVDHTGGTQQLFNSISPIAGPGTDIREYQFSVSEFSGGKLHANGGIQGSNPLPVELLSWEANAVDNEYIALSWSTATEINNDGFEIERSIDGENFESIAWKEGNGNSTSIQNYLYEDVEVSKGVRYYYRLIQIDNDGTTETFEVVSAMLTAKGESIIGNLIPNPSRENTFVRVAITSAIEEAVMVSIYNHVGARVASYKDNVSPGSNNLSININDLSSGTYFINFEGSFGRETRKLVLIK